MSVVTLSSAMPLDVWRVARVVTARISVGVVRMFAGDDESGGLRHLQAGVGVLLLGAALGRIAPGVHGNAVQRLCRVLITRVVLVECLLWVQ